MEYRLVDLRIDERIETKQGDAVSGHLGLVDLRIDERIETQDREKTTAQRRRLVDLWIDERIETTRQKAIVPKPLPARRSTDRRED